MATLDGLRLSGLIKLLAEHLAAHGDRKVVISNRAGDLPVGHVWYTPSDGKQPGVVHISE